MIVTTRRTMLAIAAFASIPAASGFISRPTSSAGDSLGRRGAGGSISARGPKPLRAAKMPVMPDPNFVRPEDYEKNLGRVMEGNARYIKEQTELDENYFKNTAENQSPEFLWIGCSDARVPANVIMGERTDTVFVTRNVANMVVNTDVNLMSVLQYATDFLKVKHIIVCGHYDCGGVKAAMTNVNHGSPLENWLRNIRDVYRLHKNELDQIPELRDRQRRLVELNVIEQCLNVFKSHVVQKRRLESFRDPKQAFTEPRIHAMVYEPGEGKLKRLPIRFSEYIEELREVYDLFPGEEPESPAAPKKRSWWRR